MEGEQKDYLQGFEWRFKVQRKGSRSLEGVELRNGKERGFNISRSTQLSTTQRREL